MKRKVDPNAWKSPIEWEIRLININSLKKWKHNPRTMSAKKMADLEASVKKFGMSSPLILDDDLTIIGGHARYEIAKKLKIKQVPCVIPNKKLNESEFRELNIRLNKNIMDWDMGELANGWNIPELLEFGFNSLELIGPNSLFDGPAEDGNKDKKRPKEIICPSCNFSFEG